MWGVHTPHLLIPSPKPLKVGESGWRGVSSIPTLSRTLSPSPVPSSNPAPSPSPGSSSSLGSYAARGFGSFFSRWRIGSLSLSEVGSWSGLGSGVGKGSESGEGLGGVHLAGTNFASVAINYTLTFIIERNGQVSSHDMT